MDTKVIFLDVDGTLVDYANNLPSSSVEAIRLARGNGHRIFLCTGRSKTERCDEMMEITGANGAVCSYGAYVECDGDILFHKTIPGDSAKEIMDYLYLKGLQFYGESCTGSFADDSFLRTAARKFAIYQGKEYVEERAREYVDMFFPKMNYGADVYRNDLEKISYEMHCREDYENVRKTFPDFRHGTWGGPDVTPTFADIAPEGVSKAQGLDVILSHIGKTRKDAIGFGDSDSDIAMIEACGFGVAMGNSSAATKAAADYVTDDIDSDGLYKAFEHLKLI